MKEEKNSRLILKFMKILQKDGAFLLEAMIGTAILSIVLVFFATVSVSAFLLMQRAYHETNISEEVFLNVESRNYSELTTDMGNKVAAADKVSFVLTEISDSDYVTFIAADGTPGALDVMEINQVSKAMFLKDLYAFRYQDSHEEYTATFYILKGEK